MPGAKSNSSFYRINSLQEVLYEVSNGELISHSQLYGSASRSRLHPYPSKFIAFDKNLKKPTAFWPTGMCFCKCCNRFRPNPLLFVFCVSFCCLGFGLAISIYDINSYGSGLYLALVSVVSVVVILAFCLVGTEEQTEPTVAKKFLSTTRQTMRKFKKDGSLPPTNPVQIKIVNIDLEAEAARSSTSSVHSSPPQQQQTNINNYSLRHVSESDIDIEDEEISV